ncbi:MAG: hypothetical protein BWX86_01795 [Verrucomicrobia bacterium ADurb.Bin122]|nr:MAG: hypothetical protein BWX86_01795 [Verrucomicrobia bacterium ADurb.Bin122]
MRLRRDSLALALVEAGRAGASAAGLAATDLAGIGFATGLAGVAATGVGLTGLAAALAVGLGLAEEVFFVGTLTFCLAVLPGFAAGFFAGVDFFFFFG